MLNAEFRSFYFEFKIRHFSIHCASAFKIAFIRCRVNNISDQPGLGNKYADMLNNFLLLLLNRKMFL